MIQGSCAPNRCPLCNKSLANAMMGVSAHLRAHVRQGKLKATGLKAMRRLILGRTGPAPAPG